MIAPDPVDLRPAHDRQKADEVRPDFVEEGEDEQGKDADTDQLIRAFILHVSLRGKAGSPLRSRPVVVEGNDLEVQPKVKRAGQPW